MRKYHAVFLAVFLALFSQCAYAEYYNEGSDGFDESHPYIIDSISDLMTLRDRVNSGEEPEDAYYRLNMPRKTMNLAEHTGWVPIGTDDKPFTGHFDGSDHTIYLNITERDGDTASLFGTIKTVEGFAVKNLTVDSSGSYTINGRYTAGIAINLSGGSIENCHFAGNMEGYRYMINTYENLEAESGGMVAHMNSGTIKNCTVKKAAIKSHTYVFYTGSGYVPSYSGGIAARVYGGNIENCTLENSSISAYPEGNEYHSRGKDSLGYAGGIVGYGTMGANQVITDCTFSGTVYGTICAGGIVGYLNDGTIKNVQVLSGSDIKSDKTAGGIAGHLQGTVLTNSHVEASTITSNSGTAGGIAGNIATGAEVESCDI
ncbi:MAG: hypothetical protein IJM68_00040 [Synergistaceae bacterium]|nr:hypothetical protein [Synergistaceae bacterium]MBR0247896.1 hypothetical protein [Synergistaceae bacterium]